MLQLSAGPVRGYGYYADMQAWPTRTWTGTGYDTHSLYSGSGWGGTLPYGTFTGWYFNTNPGYDPPTSGPGNFVLQSAIGHTSSGYGFYVATGVYTLPNYVISPVSNFSPSVAASHMLTSSNGFLVSHRFRVYEGNILNQILVRLLPWDGWDIAS